MKCHDSLKYIQLHNLFGCKKICPKIFSYFSMFNGNEKITKEFFCKINENKEFRCKPFFVSLIFVPEVYIYKRTLYVRVC